MKKLPIATILVLSVFGGYAQKVNQKYDTGFLSMFSKISFQRASQNLPILRRWNQNIRIFLESKETKKTIQQSIDINKIVPLLNGITITWVSDKNDANYLIEIDTIGSNHYYLSYDRDGNIYKCLVTINKKISFSIPDQLRVIRNYFLTSLGHFYFPRNVKFSSVNSCLYSLLNDITEFDEKVIQLEYSNELKAGMTIQEFRGLLATGTINTNK